MQSVKPWLADAARRPGARLIWASTAGLAVLALATFYVSFRAQFTFMYAVKHQDAPALIEALIADVAMVVCSLLALGMACAGQPAKAARLLVVAFAGLSAGMNYLAADVSSVRSVAVYVMPPVVFAVCTDQTAGSDPTISSKPISALTNLSMVRAPLSRTTTLSQAVRRYGRYRVYAIG